MEVDQNIDESNMDESTTEGENQGDNSNSTPGSTDQVTESGAPPECPELWSDFKCVFCSTDVKNLSNPKLLPCLHTACESCLSSESSSENSASSSGSGAKQLSCAACSQEINNDDVVDHLFLVEYARTASESLPEECSYPCTSCEEGAEGSAFCQDCQEWLCETCVSAHHRVRVTKDHIVRPKEEMEGETLRNQKYLFCPIHSHEQLKVYCETCDKLTCRDCQLSDHKDHRYQFLTNACEEEKGYITELLTKIREKQGHVQEASNNLNKRHDEIREREKIVTQEIKTFAVKFITDINKRGKALLQDLSKVCTEKKSQLNHKNQELKSVSEKLKHCQKFAEAATRLGSETALVYSKKPIMNQLRRILRHRCEVPNPNHVVDIQFNYETNFLTQYISNLGQILVDQQPIPGSNNSNAMLPMPQTISPSPAPNTPQIVQRQVQQIQMTQQRQVPMQVQQMGQQQMGPYGQPQVTSSTDMARNVNNTQMRQMLNNNQITYARNRMPHNVQPNQQTNFAMQGNTTYTPRHVVHQAAPQPTMRQHQVQQQMPQQQVQQQAPPYNNTVQLPMPLRQNKSISVTALPSPAGPSPSKQRAIAPRAKMAMNPVNPQQRMNNTQPNQQRAPQLIVLDDQPNQKTPTMSNTSRLSHFPIPATLAGNPALQIQPANYNNNSRQARRS